MVSHPKWAIDLQAELNSQGLLLARIEERTKALSKQLDAHLTKHERNYNGSFPVMSYRQWVTLVIAGAGAFGTALGASLTVVGS